MTHTLDSLCQRLNEKSYKLTTQRKVILNAFIEHGEGHLSAEDVYNLVKAKNPDIGLATVYRTLDILAELEILHKMDFGDGRSRYELGDREEHHHHHLICIQCNKVMEFEDDLLETLEASIARKSGFKIIDHDVKFYGYCDECRREKN